eukprot:Blabericola_migrator_1__252@NODE_1066_length_5548_cov_131_717570_g316_i1_p2_GENE_NODE_1066_length_5548_cov_131_717570_g316_i1NODE_1066_length_5548_cov_131_717570_g316_i1_p2_ORF_typecomplete_len539_score91_59Pribosyltran_N/PF13793_6/1_8e31Pribosyltran_N/PF13793_6/2_3Pribosyl_synth/PF14572_6/3_1e31Pribosyltran/PF00156_27/2_6e03Pribosyltran/PF00156_27/1_9e08UPRTase/PF14681_6/0_056Rhodanese/PF00581_20/15Rhodanese/PF00581_20/93_NODE_1066_length_5548_cov_131_717570_g316_i19082524
MSLTNSNLRSLVPVHGFVNAFKGVRCVHKRQPARASNRGSIGDVSTALNKTESEVTGASMSKGHKNHEEERRNIYVTLASIGTISALALMLALEYKDDITVMMHKAVEIKEGCLKRLKGGHGRNDVPSTKKIPSKIDLDIGEFEDYVESPQALVTQPSNPQPEKAAEDKGGKGNKTATPDECYQTFGDECGMMIFSGTANSELAREVCAHLDTTLGRMKVSRFNDGEVSLEVLDDVRSRDVYVFQSVPNASTGQALHGHIMELFLTISALRRASAERITAVLPYMAYSRQADVNPLKPQPLAVADMSNIIHTLGADRVVFVDLHGPRSAAFFPEAIPVTNLQPQSLAIKYLAKKSLKSPVVVATENTAAESAKAFWLRMKKIHSDVGLATLVSNRPDRLRQAGGVSAPLTPEQFTRESTAPTWPSGHSKTYFVGNVQDRDCVVVDDIIDTGVRVCNAVRACKAAGARRIFVYCTHGVLSKGSVDRLDKCGAEEVIITNTIEIPPNVYSEKIKVLNISKLVAEVLRRLHAETQHDEAVL